MSPIQLVKDPLFLAGRRAFLGHSGLLLSATSIALLSGRDGLAAQLKKSGGAEAQANDVKILNGALAAEQQGIAAYQVGAESGLLEKPVLDLAMQFQGHHKAHASLLATTIKQLGGTPLTPLQKYNFPTDK